MSGCECWSIPSKRAAWGADFIDYCTHNSLQNVHESSFFNDFIKTWLESRRPEMIFDRIRIQEHVAAQATEVLLEFFEPRLWAAYIPAVSHPCRLDILDSEQVTVRTSELHQGAVWKSRGWTFGIQSECFHPGRAAVWGGFCSHITCLVDEKETTASKKNKRENWVSVFFQGPNSLNVWIHSCRRNDTRTRSRRQHNSTWLCLTKLDWIQFGLRKKGTRTVKNSSWQVKSSVVIFSENITNLRIMQYVIFTANARRF